MNLDRHFPENTPYRTEIIESTAKRLRQEIKELISDTTVVYGLNNLDQSKLPAEERSDICIDSLAKYSDDIRQYLNTESNISIQREEVPKPGRVLFYLKIV